MLTSEAKGAGLPSKFRKLVAVTSNARIIVAASAGADIKSATMAAIAYRMIISPE
ncbi:hypothetical protein [Sphingomonas mollis]|uniref:Uncharacterized protein n=1 Tax=Sphingomonas mollis TaxID=2795726 RepID=A0ABS0XQ80_9SPHN|nr:hypothetical protein [Sphingomonas sp. BT553]MBJ6122177.1 hypothetical protein [Sphingomonas sp. BT553]